MNRSFADTSFYVALVNPRDGKHGTAMKLAQSFRGIVITTQYVLLEVANSLSRSGDKRVFLDLLKDLESDTTTIIVPTSEDLYRNGLAIFSHCPDKDGPSPIASPSWSWNVMA